MLQYLIILLDDTSTSFCHYECQKTDRQIIPLNDLKAAIRFAMMENLMIQFVYPDYVLPQGYLEVIELIDHSKIMPSTSPMNEEADVVVFNHWQEMNNYEFDDSTVYVLRIDKANLFAQENVLKSYLGRMPRLNIVITDIDLFTESDIKKYQALLTSFCKEMKHMYLCGKTIQLNLLTDRIMLTQMNNCNAGVENITLAPDGRFYICPAFYYSKEDRDTFCIGDLRDGCDIKAVKLFELSHAPLCRSCDAYHCKRCVWLNRQTTFDVTTPSHEQCVVAHVERNASRSLMLEMRKYGEFYPEQEICKINYTDPFDVRKEWN